MLQWKCGVLRDFNSMRGAYRLLFVIAMLTGVIPAVVKAQAFQPGETIEYMDRGSWPHKWERGVYIRELPGGRQVLIHQKPNQFFPKGSETAADPADLRRPGAAAIAPANPAPAQGAAATIADAGANATPAAKPTALASVQPKPTRTTPPIAGGGLLGKEEVIAYARARIGADPWKNPPRDDNLADIRDYIRARGTNFSADADFSARMNAQSSYSSQIGWAVNSNRGPHPTLSNYFGTWQIKTAANRGSHSTGSDSAGRRTIITTDSQAKMNEQLTINPDGTYAWAGLRGRWREVDGAEKPPSEGGPAIWLLKAKQGVDYMVRIGRDPAWPGWIDVGQGPGRIAIAYGQRQ